MGLEKRLFEYSGYSEGYKRVKMAITLGHLFELWILMQFTIRAVVSSEWAVWYNSTQLCGFKSSSVTFSCTYDYPDGRTVKTVQWFKPGPQPGKPIIVYNTQPDEIHTSYRDRTRITRENKNCTLSLFNVSSSDVGKYLFRFTTNAEAWTGQGGTYLYVAVLPFRVSVNSSRADNFIQEGDAVNLTCNAPNCSLPGVTWYKNGVPLSQVTSQTLSLDSVSLSDIGNYTCGQNYSDSLTAPEILLNVRYGPKNVSLAVHPMGPIQSGGSLTLICHGYANPPVERYTVFKVNGTDVLQIGWGHNHTIPSVSPRDSGQYFCLAINAVGSQNSTVISVGVEDPEHLPFLPAVLGGVLFAVIVAAVLLFIIKRKKKSSPPSESTKKLPKAKYTPGTESTEHLPDLQTSAATASEGCYDNLAVQCQPDPEDSQLTYAELQFPPASSDRSSWNRQEDISVVYSTVRTHREHKRATQEPK